MTLVRASLSSQAEQSGTGSKNDMSSQFGKDGYLHGFSEKEQDRLYEQARFLEQDIYRKVDFSGHSHILEIGCGVGAQTEILLRRFPHLKITGVDASQEQLDRAREHLSAYIKSGRVELHKVDASGLKFKEDSFDGAFITYVLEHVKKPIEVLKQAQRCLSSGAVLYVTEVLNNTFFVDPYSPATLKYWFEYNDHQWNLGGDPFVGAKLANYLLEAGYRDISTRVISLHEDNRYPKKRAQLIRFWAQLLLSGSPELLKSEQVKPELVEEMKNELERLKDEPNAVFFFSLIQARALVL